MGEYIIYIVSFVALAIVFSAGLVVLGGMKTKGRMQRALNLSLFLVRIPREAVANAQGGGQKNEKELLALGEQMLASFSNLHSKGWNKFLYGEPYIALEMAVHHLGEETHFYMAVPKSSEDIIEKQMYGYYPSAEITKVNDYSIFNPEGIAAGATISYTENSILPIRTYQKFESDPMGVILTAMSQLETEGEGAAMQILIRPTHRGEKKSLATKVSREMQSGFAFKEALKRIKHPAKPKKIDPNKPPEIEKPRVVTPADDEVIKALTNKASKQNFDVNIRFVASALNEARAQQILENLNGSLVQFASPDLNGLKTSKMEGGALKRLLYNFAFRLFNEQQVVTMSTEELASLYHFPIASTASPKVNFLKAKPSEPPSNLPTSGVIIGKNIFRGVETPVRMTDEDRRRHMYVIGQTGTGKTTIMKSMVCQDIENGKGVCIIDPHGDFAEFALSIVPKERVEDVIYFDPGDLERPLGLNMFEIDPTHPEQKTMVINELFGIIDKLYDLKTTGGPMFEKYFKNAALLLLDDYANDIPTLADISRVLVNDQFRADKLSRETNPLVKEFWQLEAEKAGGEASLANMAPYISSKVDTFVSNEFLRPIINQKKSAFNFRDIMDQKKILVVNLSKGRIGDLNANLLGMIIVGKLLMAALSRVDMDEKTRNDFYLYIDEFQNFTTDSISTILSEARKYRLNLVVGHQFIKQLKENIRDAVFGNVGSVVSFRISSDDAEFMKNKFEPVFTPQDLMNIDNLNAYVNLLVNGQTTRPFNVAIETEKVFGAGSAEVAAAIKQISRLKFGRPRDEVEKELVAKYNKI
ncbi:MAG: type IV secretion system DNA-binding domain-containing protein [bacterium]|nr:type IV secretion system DNA-binding domain-containing protein [bacterium]